MRSFSSILGSVESRIIFRGSAGSVPSDQITGFEVGSELSELSIIADEDFNVGSAWYCVNDTSGAVYRVSPEHGEGLEFVNSNLDKFIASLEAAANWSAKYGKRAINQDTSCIDALESKLTGIDSVAMSWPKNEWPSKIDHLRCSVDPSDDESVFYFRFE